MDLPHYCRSPMKAEAVMSSILHLWTLIMVFSIWVVDLNIKKSSQKHLVTPEIVG